MSDGSSDIGGTLVRMSNPDATRIPAPEEALPGRSESPYEIENRHAVLGAFHCALVGTGISCQIPTAAS